MSSSKSFQVDYLLSMSRIPVRFYGLIHNLSGRAESYQNPGISVSSFVVARGLRKEVIVLEGQMIESAKHCELFSTDRKILSQINESLINSSSQLVNQMNTLSQEQRVRLLPDIQCLYELGQMIKMSYDALLSTSPGQDFIEINNIPGITYKQALFDMQDKIGDVSQVIDSLLTPQTPIKA